MRFSLGPLGDLDVVEGVTLGTARTLLVALTGQERWREAVLGVAGRPLGDDHPAGIAPWLPGAALEVGAGAPEPAALALAAPWHLAAVAGPDAGLVAWPGRDGIVVGRGAGGDRAGWVDLTDPAVSRRHLVVRRGRWRKHPAWWARDLGSANGTAVVRAGPRRVPVGRAGRRLWPGDRILVGDGTLELRGAASRPAFPVDALGPAVVPLVMGIGVAVTARNPWFLLLGVAGPLLAVLSARRARAVAPPARAPESVPGPAALAPDAPAQTAGLLRGEDPAEPPWLALARDGLAVVGPPADRRAVARALVPTAGHATLTVLTSDPQSWRWCRWLTDRVPTPSSTPAALARADLVVGDGPPGPVLARWWAARPAGPGRPAALLLAPSDAAVPAWCAWRLVLGADGGVLRGPTDPAGRPVPVPEATTSWAEAQARRLAARGAAAAWPDRVDATRIGLPTTAAEVSAAWARDTPGLATPLGVGADGRVIAVDLAADGPHALVAGTTGSGKSELLQTLITGLAAHYPPDRLALVLVDFKGGAGFGACAGLPHVAGMVTDLDPQAAARALEALRAELRRREEMLARYGVGDLAALRAAGGRLPRLLVVVDEFRALAEDLPRFVPGLVRIAAQGRSLGIHLVLATQRPAGAVDAQMRANVALRLCLRVTDPTDSLDVVGVPDAAALPADRPGRLLLGPVEVQSAWLALPPHRRPELARASPWPDPPPPGPAPDPGHPARVVAEIRRAAAGSGLASPPPVWSPPLPDAVRAGDLAAEVGGVMVGAGDAAPDSVAIALGDPPGGQGRCAVRVPVAGPLAIVGRPGSGRTTALLTLAGAALAAGRTVHVIAPPGGAWVDWAAAPSHPRRGTVAVTDDPRLVTRLLTLLLDPRFGTPALLLVDGLAGAQAALDRMPRQLGAGLLDRALRDGRHTGLGVAVTGTPSELARTLPLLPDRLVLPVVEPADDLLLGVDRDLGGRSGPGRAVALLGADRAGLRCQIALPDPEVPDPGAPDPAVADPGTARPGTPDPATVRLRPIPTRVALPHHRDPGALAVRLGLGGDDAGPVDSVADPLLVVGPAGSGRTTALARVTAGLRANGLRTVVLTGSGPAPDDPSELDAVVVDDADDLDPETDDRLAGWVRDRRAGRAAPAVVAAARTGRVAAAYRGLVAELRTSAPMLVLDPAAPGSAEVAGTRLDAVVDPVRPGHPGRGCLVTRAGVTPLQVSAPERAE